MNYYLIAGEASGDLHGSNLIKALKQLDSSATFRCWGGDKMHEAGAELVKHYNQMAFMGFWEVAKNIRSILSNLKHCKQDLLTHRPDALILIDYAAFNMRIAKFASKHGIPVHYYISPKIWAWNQSRALKIKRWVKHMYVILPFEKDFYRQYQFDVHYVGNPLLDAIKQFSPTPDFLKQHNLNPDRKIIAILPGSRKQEIQNMLSTMLQLANFQQDYQYVVAALSQLDPSLYDEVKENSSIRIITDQTYDLLHHAHAAVVTSGTATLETALFHVPQVVCYRTSKISYSIAKRLIKVPYISLVNLIAGHEVVRELIQDEFNVHRLSAELEKIVYGSERETQLMHYQELTKKIGTAKPSEHTARLIIQSFGIIH
jgi:lipid-A-disaccharide synthase